MTDVVYDREFDTEGTSTVIDRVYYSTKDKLLFVQLHRTDWHGDPILAGYQDVPADVFTALETTNQNRIKGDQNASVGSYWNLWIKPYFTGYDTSEVELVSAEEEAKNAPVFGSRILTGSGVVVASTLAPVQPNKTEFTINFVDDQNESCSLTLFAADVNDALLRFNGIAETAQWDTVEITSVTQHFA